jgi:hypothetical protein
MIAGSGSVFRTSLLYAISAFLLAGFFVPESLNVQDHFYVRVPRPSAAVSPFLARCQHLRPPMGADLEQEGHTPRPSLPTAGAVSADVAAASRGEHRLSGAN